MVCRVALVFLVVLPGCFILGYDDPHLASITHDGETYVAVGDEGVIVRSDDGKKWTAGDSGTTPDLYSVVHGNGVFVAVGDGGTVLASTDGVLWATQPSVTTAPLGMWPTAMNVL